MDKKPLRCRQMTLFSPTKTQQSETHTVPPNFDGPYGCTKDVQYFNCINHETKKPSYR